MSALKQQADSPRGSRRAHSTHSQIKRGKRRAERRKLKRDPEAVPQYNRYSGYET